MRRIIMKADNMEIRAFTFEVRANADEEHGKFLEGTPIVYDSWTNLGWYDEMIDRGALADTDLRDVRFLVNHNTDMIPLARSRNNNEHSTMQMSIDDEIGMKIRVNLDVDNNAEAKALYSAVERGDLDGMSFMFTVDGDRWEDESSEHPKRHIEKISKVFEVSAVTFPAYEATSIQARGLADALDSAKASLDSVKAEKRRIEAQKQRIRIMSEV
jgi:HK97 family phage prohead protease